jgi:hypothetical protein
MCHRRENIEKKEDVEGSKGSSKRRNRVIEE